MKRLLSLALIALALAGTPAMAALTATTKGNAVNASNHQLTINSITIPSGDLIVVMGFMNKAADADNVIVTNNLGDSFTVYQCKRATGLANVAFIAWAYSSGMSGGSVTVADDVAATASQITYSVYGLNGVPGSNPEDAASRACANSESSGPVTNPSVTSGTPSQAGNMFFSVYGGNTNGTTIGFTEDATWTGGYGTGNTSIVELSGYKLNAGSGTVSRSPTTASRVYAMPITSFKDAGAAAVKPSNLTTLGVGN